MTSITINILSFTNKVLNKKEKREILSDLYIKELP